MKTKSKKIISVLLCLILTVCVLSVSASAESPIEIRVSSAECLAGETVVVTIDLINNPGLASLKLKVTYDSVLSLQSVVYNTAMGGQTIQPQTMDSPVTIMWVSPFAEYSSDTTFASLTFVVSEDATPNSVANISLTYDPNDIYDISENNLNCVVTNGKITIGPTNSDEGYITPTEHSKIDYEKKIVFADIWCETDIAEFVQSVGGGSVEAIPNSSGFLGTGSTVVFNDGTKDITYNVVIAGDVDGDSVCDVIDAALVNLAVSEKLELSAVSKCAATLVAGKEVDVYDYQNIVNWVVSGSVRLNEVYTVTFEDYNGDVLKTESVISGGSTTPPTKPVRDGYEFVGWDKSIDNITADTTIRAKYVALEGPAFAVEYVTAQAGADNIAVAISLKNNPGIASIGMYVNCDPALTLTNIVYNNSMGGQAVPPQSLKNRPIKLTWVSPFANATEDTVFATLYFSVDESASGELPIELTYNENDVYDMTETNIGFAVINNSVLVIK